MDNMFNILDMMGLNSPVTKKVENTSNKKEDKSDKKQRKTANKEVKNIINLPVKVVIQDVGTVTITPDDLNSSSSISNVELQRYLNEHYPVTKYMDNVLEGDIYYYGVNTDKAKKGNFKVSNETKLMYGNTIINLGELADGNLTESEVSAKELAEFSVLSGLFLGNTDNVAFVEHKKDNILIPIPCSIKDQDIKEYKIPLSISFAGEWDDIVIYDEMVDNPQIADNLTLNNIKDVIIKKYPELNERIQFTGFSDNTVFVHMLFIKKTEVKKTEKDTFKIDDKTVIKYYGNIVKLNLAEGTYSLQEISKALVKAGIDECKGGIVAKKTGNIILTGAKFGGTKGAISDRQLEIIKEDYSTCEIEDDSGYLKVHPVWMLHINNNNATFGLRLPKIPYYIYNNIVSLFRTVAVLFNKECLARIYWDMSKNQYDLRIPYQRASISTVENFKQEDDDYLVSHIPVIEVHSHGRAYDAFFSSIDDADEEHRYGLYGVFSFKSGIDVKEDCLFRCCSGMGRQLNLKKEELFESGKYIYNKKFVDTILSSNRLL